MTSAGLLEAANENYELPTYLPTTYYYHRHRARTKAETTTSTTTTTDRLEAQIRTSVRGRPWGSSRVKENSTAIYICAAMPRGSVRRETVVFLRKRITGVDQRRETSLAGRRRGSSRWRAKDTLPSVFRCSRRWGRGGGGSGLLGTRCTSAEVRGYLGAYLRICICMCVGYTWDYRDISMPSKYGFYASYFTRGLLYRAL